jgi:diguanylate cyclase (GGDEF)-like protein/PAS domain S-box-containing protein
MGRPLPDEHRQVRSQGDLALVRDPVLVTSPAAWLGVHDAELLRVLADTMHAGMTVQDRDGRILTFNARALSILGLTEDQLLGRTSLDPAWQTVHEDGTLFAGEDHPAMVTLATGRALSGVVMGVHRPDGALSWISINTRPVAVDESGKPRGVVVTFLDISGSRSVEGRLRRSERLVHEVRARSEVDALTSLPGRAVFERELRVALDGSGQQALALVLFDVDRFHEINERHGARAGDEILKAFSAALRGSVRRDDVIARWGADQFALLLRDVGGRSDVMMVIEAVLNRVRHPLLLSDGAIVNVDARAGVALTAEGAVTADQLRRRAEAALAA